MKSKPSSAGYIPKTEKGAAGHEVVCLNCSEQQIAERIVDSRWYWIHHTLE
jgi:hypothetical protein